jgi:hypothetical protein
MAFRSAPDDMLYLRFVGYHINNEARDKATHI